MAEIPTFNAKAPRGDAVLPVDTSTGAAQVFGQISATASRIAARIGQKADKRAIAENVEQAKIIASNVPMPSVDFAFQEVKGPDGKPYPAQKIAPAKASARAAAARDYLMKAHGLSAHAAAAMAGHGMAESRLDPNVAPGDQGTAFGIYQWRGNRLSGLKQFAASKGKAWNDFHVQLDYAVHEMNTSETTAGRAIRAARNVDEATAAFMHFERPQGYTMANPRGGHNFSGRLAFAQGLLSGAGASTEATDPVQTGAIAASAPAVDAPMLPGAGPSMKATATITGKIGALPRMQAGTLAGDAFNAAAMEVYSNRADTALRAQMDALAINHQDDPQALNEAMNAMWQGMAGDIPAQVKPMLDQTFQRGRASLLNAAAQNFNTKLEKEALASFEANIMARTDAVLKRAVSLPMTPEGDAALTQELADVSGRIDASNLSPAEKLRMKGALEQNVTEQRILSGFENEKDPAKRAAFAENFEREWQASEGFGGKVNIDTRDRLRTTMLRGMQADQADADKRGTVLQKTIDGQLGFLKKGLPVSSNAISAIRSEVERTGSVELSANLAFLDGLANWQKAAVGLPPAVVAQQITAMRRQMAEKGATEQSVTTLDVMESLHGEMTKQLKNDPLTFAQASGTHLVEPIDMSDPARMQASLAERAADAAAVAKRYNIQPQFFTQSERDAITKVFEDNPDQLPQLATGLASGLGKDAPAALKELSKDAPVLAHVGGLMLANGNQRFAVDLADGLSMRKVDGYKSALPSDKQLADAAQDVLGASLSRTPEVASAATAAATAAFERRMAKKGLSIKDFDNPDSPARREYQAAINEALGATFDGNVQYGGLTQVNGFETVAPADMRADHLAQAIGAINADDMAALDIKPVNGVSFTPAQLRRAQLVPVGDGLYRMALGDPFSDEPQFVKRPDGSDYELDIRALASRQKSSGRLEYGDSSVPAEQFGQWNDALQMFVVPQ